MPRKKEPTCVTEKYTFPTRLRKLMEKRGITQKTLADAIKMRPQTVSLYTTGQSSPDVNALKKIAEFFNVSSDYLLGLAKDETPDPDIQNVIAYTGLSASAIMWLNKQSKRDYNPLEVVSSLLQHKEFRESLFDILNLKIEHAEPTDSNDPLSYEECMKLNELLHKSGLDTKHCVVPRREYFSYKYRHLTRTLEFVISDIINGNIENDMSGIDLLLNRPIPPKEGE